MSDDKSENFIWKLKNGDLDDIKEYVQNEKIDVNKDIKGRMPIHYAADYGQKDVIDYLVSKGANVNAEDKHGLTPLLNAIYEGHSSCVELLIAKGAKKSGKAPDGSSYIDCAEKDDIKALLK